MHYLSECSFEFLPAIDFEVEWKAVESIVNRHPWLCWQGYFRSEKDYRRSITNLQSDRCVDHWRDKRYLDQVYRAKCWLNLLKPSSRFNRRHTSYGLKHFCERWWRPYVSPLFSVCDGYTSVSSYVSNGSLILAALSLGWDFSTTNEGRNACPNVYFPFSEKSLRLLRPEGYLF